MNIATMVFVGDNSNGQRGYWNRLEVMLLCPMPQDELEQLLFEMGMAMVQRETDLCGCSC